MRRACLAFAAAVALSPAGVVQTAPPIDVTVPKAPAPFRADGRTHLVYELHVANAGAGEVALDRVAVTGDGAAAVAYEGEALVDAVARPGLPALRGAAKLTIGSGQRAVVYVWSSFADDQVPRTLQHHLSITAGEPRGAMTMEAARVTIAAAPRTIAPPLAGAGCLAANGPSHSSGHRRTLVPIYGTHRIPQRFAIDWLQVRPDGTRYAGDPKDNRSYHAYGQAALAVADGVVSSVRDGIPENVPGPASRAVPITLETVGGNYVILNLGDGVYAFYAHLQPRSITVRLGDPVRRGQVLGLVGNSGNSSEPHLHFHLIDANSPLAGEGIPYALTAFDVEGRTGVAELRTLELPLENAIVRFPGEGKR